MLGLLTTVNIILKLMIVFVPYMWLRVAIYIASKIITVVIFVILKSLDKNNKGA